MKSEVIKKLKESYHPKPSEKTNRYTDLLFRKITREKVEQRCLLICPRCKAGMQPLLLAKDMQGYQTIWWVCKNTIEQKCDFPGEVPPEVFWVKRSPEEISEGHIPLPNLEALPAHLWHLYPMIYPGNKKLPPCVPIPSQDQTTRESSPIPIEESSTRALSFASESGIGFVGSEIETTAVDPSVMIIEDNPKEARVCDSNSFVTDSSTASETSVWGKPGVVPTTSNITPRKRPATDDSSSLRDSFNKHFAEYLRDLKKRGEEDSHLVEIAKKMKELEEALAKPKIKEIDRLSQDEYNDHIASLIPEVTREQAAKALQDKSIEGRFTAVSSLRKAKSGADLLKNLGFAGAPLTDRQKWREETTKQVSNVLSRAAKETKKALARQVALKNKDSCPSESLPPYVPSTSKQVDDEKQRQKELEAKRKTDALIQSKLRARLEAQKQGILNKRERLRQQRQQQLQQQEDLLYPEADPSFQPMPTSTRERLDSFNMDSYPGFSDSMMMDMPSSEFSHDLFDDLGL